MVASRSLDPVWSARSSDRSLGCCCQSGVDQVSRRGWTQRKSLLLGAVYARIRPAGVVASNDSTSGIWWAPSVLNSSASLDSPWHCAPSVLASRRSGKLSAPSATSTSTHLASGRPCTGCPETQSRWNIAATRRGRGPRSLRRSESRLTSPLSTSPKVASHY